MIKNFDDFIKHLERQERSKNTIDTYIHGIKVFFEMYEEVNTESVLGYKEWLKKSFKPKTVNIRICGLIQYSKFIGKPVEVKGLKVQKALSVENVISTEEFENLLSGLRKDKNTRGYWMVLFLAKTGARVSEFVRFTKNGLENGYEDLFTKGKVRRIFFPKDLITESRWYFETVHGEYLFPSLCQNIQYRGKPITPRGVSQTLQQFAKRYGIRKEVMHPHGFRHFFAKEFLRNGGELSLLSDVLGHEDLGTTAVYTRATNKEMSEKISRLMGKEITKNNEPVKNNEVANDIILLQSRLINAQQQVIECQNKLLEMGAL
jgi:site-specific recombinase XerD